MTDWSEFDTDETETFFARRRLDSRTYASRSFPLTRTNSDDQGAPARYLYKVFDPASQTEIIREAEEWVIRESPAGRVQIKLLVAREAGNVKEIWIHRVPSAEAGGSVRTLLNLQQPEVGRLIEFLRLLAADQRLRRTPVVVCSGASDLTRVYGSELATLGYEVVRKPFELEDLIGSVRRAVWSSQSSW